MALQPLETGDILDRAVKLYRDNFAPFLLIVLSVRLPIALLQVAQIYFLYAAGLGQFRRLSPEDLTKLDMTALSASLVIGLVTVLPAWIGSVLSSGALIWAASQRYFGQPASFGQAYRAAWSRIWDLLLISLLWGLVISVASMFCLVPGIVLAVWFCFYFPVVMLERLGAVDTLGRSKSLVDGHWWRVAWPLEGLAVMAFVAPALVIAMPLSYVCERWLSRFITLAAAGGLAQFIYQLALIVLAPIMLCGLVVLYYDRRVRREGMDLELRAQEMAASA